MMAFLFISIFYSKVINFILTFGFHSKTFNMNEDQAQTMIDLLEDIADKLKKIDNKINSSYDLGDVCSKLDSVVTKLGYIDSNTSTE